MEEDCNVSYNQSQLGYGGANCFLLKKMHFHLFHSLNTLMELYSKGKGNFKNKTKD